jgi:hypothetical protein
MRSLVFPLLFGLVLVPAPVQAQSVTLTVCNIGKVDIDVFIAMSSSHIRPANCAVVARTSGSMEPAYVGLAFTDAQGQLRTARRFDRVPSMGDKNFPVATRLAMSSRRETPPGVLTLATGSETVRRGSLSLPMQLLFQPSIPDCRAVPTGGGATLGRTTVIEVTQLCEDLGYTLKVEAYPDTREIRLASLPVSGEVSEDGPVRISEKTIVNWTDEDAARREREEPEAVKWVDLLGALRMRDNQGSTPPLWDWIPRHMVIRGTVSRVDVTDGVTVSGTKIQIANVFFRESPPVDERRASRIPVPTPEFNMCTDRPDILQERFGADFRTSMLGKSIEVRAETGGAYCRGSLLSSMQIYLAHEVRPVPSAQFAAGTRFWVPPPSAVPPPSISRAEKDALLGKLEDEQARRVACAGEAAKKYPQYWLADQSVGYQNAVRDCLIAAGLSAPAPAVYNRPPTLTDAELTAAMSVPTPVVRTFSTAPAPRSGALSIADFNSQWFGKAVVATGTVARVETIRGYEHLYFQGAGSKLVVCFAQGFGGVKNASELIGKTIEVSVRIDSPAGCLDHRVETVGAAEIRQLNQLRLIGDARPVK